MAGSDFSGKRGASEQEKKLHDYLVSKSVHQTAPLEKLQKASLEHPRARMCSPPDSIAVLQLFLNIVKAKKAIEVGTFTGYTALGIAQALPPGGKLYTLDITDEYPSIGKPFWEEAGLSDKIDLRIGSASEELDKLLKELGPDSVDFGFIDANKNDYDIYYEFLLKLVRPGGVIAVDNVLWGGNVLDESDQSDDTKAIRAINDKIFNDKRVKSAILKNSDGIGVVVKL